MINVVRFVMSGEVYAPVEMGLKRRESEVSVKTARGETIAKLVVLGKTNKEICEILNVPMSTVKMDIRILCKKRYARNRTELAVKLAKDTADLDMSA
jgi:two-component system nitrate/nitrite response regulator NarL